MSASWVYRFLTGFVTNIQALKSAMKFLLLNATTPFYNGALINIQVFILSFIPFDVF